MGEQQVEAIVFGLVSPLDASLGIGLFLSAPLFLLQV